MDAGAGKMEPMGVVAVVALTLFCLAGIVLTPLGLPGTFVIFAGAAVYNLFQWSMALLRLTVLGILLAIAVAGEILERFRVEPK